MNDLTYYQEDALDVRQNSGNVANPFGAPSVPAFGGNVAIAQAVSEKFSEMQARMMIAQQFPRDEAKAMDGILNACRREGLAVKGTYCYARGGQNISGPSIRLAEEIMRHWKHIDARWKEVERGDDYSTVECTAWDMSSNIIASRVVRVPHYRDTKSGRKRLTDERDINEMLANQAARRLRMCILSLIPGDVVEAAVDQCHKTVAIKCDISPARIQGMLEQFAKYGVSQAQIEKRIQRKISAIAPAQFVSLMDVFNSLRDGIGVVSDWFEEEQQQEALEAPRQTQAEALKITLKRSRVKKEQPVEVQQQASPFEMYKTAIENADSRESLEKLGQDVSNSELPQGEATDLFKLIDSVADSKGL